MSSITSLSGLYRTSSLMDVTPSDKAKTQKTSADLFKPSDTSATWGTDQAAYGLPLNGSSSAQTLYDAQSSVQEAASPPQTAADKFLDMIGDTPEERMRAAFLAEMGVTEEELAAMSPEDREKFEAKLRERIEEKIKQSMEENL